MDDSQIRIRKPGMRTATIVDVLYADDCVLFTNTITAMQILIVVFDNVATLFGMELAIQKFKIVCNQYSRSIEREAQQEVAGDESTTLMHNTRGRQALAQMQINDESLFIDQRREDRGGTSIQVPGSAGCGQWGIGYGDSSTGMQDDETTFQGIRGPHFFAIMRSVLRCQGCKCSSVWY